MPGAVPQSLGMGAVFLGSIACIWLLGVISFW